MKYKLIAQNGYILGVCEVATGGNISQKEYARITDIIHNMPAAPPGYGYRLREDLEWELYELPEMTDIPEEVTEGDYIAALGEMGVSL